MVENKQTKKSGKGQKKKQKYDLGFLLRCFIPVRNFFMSLKEKNN